jgi:PAS domain S-box-containing protein
VSAARAVIGRRKVALNADEIRGHEGGDPRRVEAIFDGDYLVIVCQTDRLLRDLMAVQWMAGIGIVLWLSPRTWTGPQSRLYPHVLAAVFLGGVISALPIFLATTRPGQPLTRHAMAAGQMLMSALLTHLTGDRIETNFHVFGSLAFLSFYRDWRVLVTASAMVGLDHFARGVLWPESVYGMARAPVWRAFEHVGWVVFEEVFLLIAMRQSVHEMDKTASRQAALEALNGRVEDAFAVRTATLTNEVEARRRVEESLRLLASAVEQSKESILITDAEIDLPGPHIVFVNPAFTALTGYSAAEAIGNTPRMLQGPQTDPAMLKQVRRCLQTGAQFEGEAINYRKDGQPFNLSWKIAPIRSEGGRVTHFVALQSDITERKRIAAQLLESRKLETVGRLAGGFAHEFNTLLSLIIGQSEMLISGLPPESPLAKGTGAIRQAASRAATLTRQLLAYGRKQMLQPVALDLNQMLLGMEDTFAELLGKKIAVLISPGPQLPPVRADAQQIMEVLNHMLLNARDAMPAGGTLTLTTRGARISPGNPAERHDVQPGDYVVLTIADTGTGMSLETRARAFDPFFSTKGVGRGTGLGLATCYGIIKQSGGDIYIDSEVTQGTAFNIYLPQAQPRPAATALVETGCSEGNWQRQPATILVTGSDRAICDLAGVVLKKMGYYVQSFIDPQEALACSERLPTIDLLLTDMALPAMGGMDLAASVRRRHPETKVLFTSTTHKDAEAVRGLGDAQTCFLPKPFSPSELRAQIERMLHDTCL